MKIYIAGPMSGLKNWNFPAFFQAERLIKSLGHEVINPAHNNGETLELALKDAGPVDRPNHSWEHYIRRDVPMVMSCDAVCVLPGWQESKGAQLEVHIANELSMPVFCILDGQLLPRVRAIGLSGYARSGKDTVAARMVSEHGYTRISFADPIREALERLNPHVEFGGYYMPLATALRGTGWETLKDLSPGSRVLLQRMGTEVAREMFSQDFWVEQALKKIPDGAKVVFADVRYPNEAEAVRSLGGQVWRVVRQNTEAANSHTSESAMDNYSFDAVIKNFAEIEELDSVVDHLVWGANDR
jgi:hypothetical protein